MGCTNSLISKNPNRKLGEKKIVEIDTLGIPGITQTENNSNLKMGHRNNHINKTLDKFSDTEIAAKIISHQKTDHYFPFAAGLVSANTAGTSTSAAHSSFTDILPHGLGYEIPTESLHWILKNNYTFYDPPLFDEFDETIAVRHRVASVLKAVHKSGAHLACKVVLKGRTTVLESIKAEIEIMKRVRHPNVVSLYETYESPTCFCLMMELNMNSFVNLRKFISTLRISELNSYFYVMTQILEGLQYLHSRGIVHRDVKLDNILLNTVTSHDGGKDLTFSVVKIANFGTATLLDVGLEGYDFSDSLKSKSCKKLKERVGAPVFYAPELIAGAYGPQVDIWSAGCLLYELLTGARPFEPNEKLVEEDCKAELFVRIGEGKYNRDLISWLSDEARDLIGKMLTVDPVQRPDASEALTHPWITENIMHYTGQKATQSSAFSWSSWADPREWTQVGTQVVGGALADAQKGLKEALVDRASLDVNGDGQISLEEMQVWFGIPKDGIAKDQIAKDRSPTDRTPTTRNPKYIQLTEYNPPNTASVQSFLWLREAPSPARGGPEEAAPRLLDIATVIPHHMGDQRSEPASAIELSEFEAEAKKRSLDIPFEVTKDTVLKCYSFGKTPIAALLAAAEKKRRDREKELANSGKSVIEKSIFPMLTPTDDAKRARAEKLRALKTAGGGGGGAQRTRAENVFVTYGRDGDSLVASKQFQALCEEHGLDISIEDAEQAVKRLDVDGDGKISPEEFQLWLRSKEADEPEYQAFKVVHKVKRIGFDQQYACKIMRKSDFSKEIYAEIEAMKRVQHRHVASLFDIYKSPEHVWFILERVEGGDLRGCLASRKTYTEALVSRHMRQLLEGINYLHSRGVVHRDIQLDNILVTWAGDVKIANFGMSVLIHLDSPSMAAFTPSAFINLGIDENNAFEAVAPLKRFRGIPHHLDFVGRFFAPERFEPSHGYGPQVDLWGAGCVLYELLTGEEPFEIKRGEVVEVDVYDGKPLDRGLVKANYQGTMITKIKQTAFNREHLHGSSPEAEELLSHLLQVQEIKRFNAAQALDPRLSRWITSDQHVHSDNKHMANAHKKLKESTEARATAVAMIKTADEALKAAVEKEARLTTPVGMNKKKGPAVVRAEAALASLTEFPWGEMRVRRESLHSYLIE